MARGSAGVKLGPGEGERLSRGEVILGSMAPAGVRPPAAPAHLQQHVPRFNAAISCHGATLHNGANVDATIPAVIALAHNADAQEVVPFCGGKGQGECRPHSKRPPPARAREASPMLSVTVTMFRDMVESVMLLKEDACGDKVRVQNGVRGG